MNLINYLMNSHLFLYFSDLLSKHPNSFIDLHFQIDYFLILSLIRYYVAYIHGSCLNLMYNHDQERTKTAKKYQLNFEIEVKDRAIDCHLKIIDYKVDLMLK